MSLSARGVAAMCGGAEATPTPVVDVAMPSNISDEIATVACARASTRT